jgi:hypothetical protein
MHETAHLMGYTDRESPNAYSIARKCFSCAVTGGN